MTIKKSLLSVCLSISLMFGCFAPSINVYASEQEPSAVERFTQKFYEVTKEASGIIFSPLAGVKDSFIQWLGDHKQNYGGSNQTTDDFISSNFDFTQSNYNIGENLINSMRDFNQYYISNDSNIRYGFSYGVDQWQDRFQNPALYNSFVNLITEYDGYLILCYTSSYNWPHEIYVYDSSVIPVLDSFTSDYIAVDLYNTSGQLVTNNDLVAVFGANGSVYEPITVQSPYHDGYFKYDADDPIVSLPLGYRYTNLEPTSYVIYDTLNAGLNNDGSQDYYITDSYNTNHVSNSMTISSSDIDNSITYGDVTNYIDSFRDTNGRNPTITEINIYINTYDPSNPTPTPTPTPTPDPDNPGGDDDNENIWDFLSDLGEIIGNLIAGLGEVLAGILSAISSIITSLKEGIPNTIGLFLEWFFPFLPPEIVGLIELSILCMVIIGVVRLIRGH